MDESELVVGGSGMVRRVIWQDDGAGPFLITDPSTDGPCYDAVIGLIEDSDARRYVGEQAGMDVESDDFWDNPIPLTYENTIAYARQVVREYF